MMESRITPQEQEHIDSGQLTLHGINFSIENGTALRRKDDVPVEFVIDADGITQPKLFEGDS